MVSIILVFKKSIVKKYTFTKDSITIGRDKANDIVIDNLIVSNFHAKIDKTGEVYILTDLQSTNGTIVNREKIVSHQLRHKDKIIIGKHLLFFAMSKQDQLKAENADIDKTMIIDSGKYKELVGEKTEKNGIDVQDKKHNTGIISFVDKSGRGEIVLRKKLTKIGKAKTSEIKLGGFFIPPTAAAISHRPDGYAITPIGKNSKVKVNDQVIAGSHFLNDFDIIEIGSHKFQFYTKNSEDLEDLTE